MTRHDFNAREALVPGTWQNRQGREHEWHAASVRTTWLAVVTTLVAAAAMVALCYVASIHLAPVVRVMWGSV